MKRPAESVLRAKNTKEMRIEKPALPRNTQIHSQVASSPAVEKPALPPQKVQIRSYVAFPCDTAAASSPAAALEHIMAGNARFVAGQCGVWGSDTCPPGNPAALSLASGKDSVVRARLTGGQHPLICVVGCADSRSPAEAIFDQCSGDIFTVRIAGSVYTPAAAGSIDFAVKHLKCQVLMILGHTACGAVKAAQLPRATIRSEPPALADLLLEIKKGIEKEGPEDMNERNVHSNVARALRDPLIRAAVGDGKLLVVGAIYDLVTGVVTLLDC
jgi:carbonic anhydrase